MHKVEGFFLFLFTHNKLISILVFILLSFFHNTLIASSNIKVIFAASMPDISDVEHGSYAELATLLKEEKAKDTEVIFLFGGDSLGPSTMSSLDKGVHIIDILNTLEPDAVSINKREFSFYTDELSLRSYEASFPLVASNIVDKSTNINVDGINDNLLIEKEKINIGIISVLNKNVIEEYGLKRISIIDIEESVKKHAKSLREQGANYIILLPSNVFDITQKLLDEKIIDLSLDKNTHFKLKSNQNRSDDHKNILITNKGIVLMINISIDTETNKLIKFKSTFANLNDYKKDTEVLNQVTNYTNRLNSLFQEKIGIFTKKVNTNREVVRGQESIFGNVIADALKKYANADIGWMNGGSIRGETIYKKNHQISRRDITKELPFRNSVTLIEVKGEQILDALENSFSLVENLKGRFLHFSGMEVLYDKSEKVGQRVKKVLINKAKLQKKKTYTIATTSYLASGGDGYTMLLNSKQLNYSNSKKRLLSNILIDYIIDKKIISNELEGRIKEVSSGK